MGRTGSRGLLVLTVIAGLLVGPARPQEPGASLEQRFRQFDRDGDGRITRDEAGGAAWFDRLDANRDGVVTIEEAKAAVAAGRDGRPPAPQRPAPQPDEFIPDAPFVGEVGGSYIDPEFSEGASQVVFQDVDNRVWIGDLDPATGRFKSAAGRDYLMDEDITIIFDRPPQGRKFSTNGPEWTHDEQGYGVVYTKADAAGVMQQWLARWVNGKSEVTQLTRGGVDCYGNMPSRFDDGQPTRLAYTFNWPIYDAEAAWIFLDRPAEPHVLAGFDYRMMSMWSAVSPEFLFVQRKPGATVGQIAKANADTGEVQVLTNDEGQKDDPGLFRAPEFGGELLLVCNVDNQALGIYRDLRAADGTWTRIATLRLPEGHPHTFISSPETIAPATGVGGVSSFALLSREGKERNTPGSIWVLGLGADEQHRFVRRVDDGAPGSRGIVLEPEPFVGTHEVYVYYNAFEPATGRNGVKRAATGIKFGDAVAAAPAVPPFAVDDVIVSPPGRVMVDPEFNDVQHRMAYWDYGAGGQLNISVAELDHRTGLLKSPGGRDFPVDEGVSPSFRDGRWWSHNGPEWGRDRDGWAIHYTKEDAKGSRQIGGPWSGAAVMCPSR